MAYGSWEKVINEYQTVYTKHERTVEHARGMLDLFPLIREHPAFQELLPGTSHATLFFNLPNKRTQICVWYQAGVYEIYFYDPALSVKALVEFDDERVVVDLPSVVTALREQINKIKNGEDYP